MTVDDLREILDDPDLPGDTLVKVQTQYRVSTWEWELQGALATLAGPDRHVTLELWTPGPAGSDPTAGR